MGGDADPLNPVKLRGASHEKHNHLKRIGGSKDKDTKI